MILCTVALFCNCILKAWSLHPHSWDLVLGTRNCPNTHDEAMTYCMRALPRSGGTQKLTTYCAKRRRAVDLFCPPCVLDCLVGCRMAPMSVESPRALGSLIVRDCCEGVRVPPRQVQQPTAPKNTFFGEAIKGRRTQRDYTRNLLLPTHARLVLLGGAPGDHNHHHHRKQFFPTES